jgi:drug/metabolite transporter (DMT)-like permease
MSAHPPPLPAVLAAAATGVQVGAAIVATRYVVDQVDPIPLAFLRYAIGFCCLFPAALAAGRPRFARRDLLPMALLGVAQFGLLIVLLNYGLRDTPAGLAGVIFATMPLLTALFGAVLARERLSAANVAGVVLTVIGVAFALGEKLRGEAGGSWSGELAVFLSALTGALCSVLYRPYLGRYPALPVSALAMFAAVAFLGVLAGTAGFFDHRPSITGHGWAAIVFIGLSSGIGYFLWLYALKHASPTRVTVFLALSPVTAALLGALLLGESMTAGLWLGLAAVAAGLKLALGR